MSLDRISIELTNQCAKACRFCYNHSQPHGFTHWEPDEVISFVRDCAGNGIKAVSFGGGEPLQYPGLYEILHQLKGVLFRSITTNGLLLEDHIDQLVRAAPDKVHVSIHFPEREAEVTRVIAQVHELAHRGIVGGINFLVTRSGLHHAIEAAKQVRDSGIGNERIVYLPMRSADTPTPEQVAEVAGNAPFQSMSCLARCGRSERFCSISWDKQAAWCSYTSSRRPLPELTFAGMCSALRDLELTFCGDDDGKRLSRRPLDGHAVVRG